MGWTGLYLVSQTLHLFMTHNDKQSKMISIYMNYCTYIFALYAPEIQGLDKLYYPVDRLHIPMSQILMLQIIWKSHY